MFDNHRVHSRPGNVRLVHCLRINFTAIKPEERGEKKKEKQKEKEEKKRKSFGILCSWAGDFH